MLAPITGFCSQLFVCILPCFILLPLFLAQYAERYSRCSINVWASVLAQTVKNPPAMQETWALPLAWEDSPGGGHSNPLQYSCLENLHEQEEPGRPQPCSRKESDMTEQLSLHWELNANKKFFKLNKTSFYSSVFLISVASLTFFFISLLLNFGCAMWHEGS